VQLLQGRRGIEAHLAVQLRLQVPVAGQGIGLAAGPVRGQHEKLPHPLPERLGYHHRSQPGDDLRMMPELQRYAELLFFYSEAEFTEPAALFAHVMTADTRQGPAPPQRQGLPQPLGGRVQRALGAQRACLFGQRAKVVQVDVSGPGRQGITRTR
jgi:hypothetical protein